MSDHGPTLTPEGYPTEETLQRIARWEITPSGWWADCRALLAFVRQLWHFGDWGWLEEPLSADGLLIPRPMRLYRLSTGGWSGNENLIAAMEENFLFWGLCWYSHRRGGHYEFRVEEGT